MRNRLAIIIAFSIAIIILATKISKTEAGILNNAPGQRGGNKSTIGTWGIDVSHLSATVKPGDDFFTYVNEGWIKTTQLPEGVVERGAFTEVGEKTDERVTGIIRDAANSPTGEVRQKIGDLYSSFLDTERIEKLGLAPLQGDLRRIRAIKTHQDVAQWMADPSANALVAINVFPDAGDTRRWLVYLDQNERNNRILGLPDREYYERADGDFPSHRAAYAVYIAETLKRIGMDQPEKRAADILALETKLASKQWDMNQRRDRKANYHLMTRKELNAYAPGFPWDTFLKARKVGDVKEIVLGTDTAVQAQAKFFAETSVEVWTSYLTFHWIQNQIEFLPAAFETASFDFYNRRLWGAKAPVARDKRAIGFVNGNLGEAVGRLYVEKYFSPESRKRATELFDYLSRAFAEGLSQAEWMDDKTRAEAQAKLAAFRIKVGYPTTWRNYSSLVIKRDDLIGNMRRIREADWNLQRSRLAGKDRNLIWYQTPQTVDASFSVLLNAIELPAGLLQPPFFDPYADPAVNFGSIGAVIGHEMGHAFDDQGANFDGQGRMRNWWTKDSRNQFEERTAALVTQYNTYSPLEGVQVNGKQTIGENIGDLTGVSLAYRAYQLYLKEHHQDTAPVLDGFSGDQRFFLSWAQTWHYVATDGAFRYIVKSTHHSPAQFRVNGVVRNLGAWYTAFGVGPSQKLYLPTEERVRLW